MKVFFCIMPFFTCFQGQFFGLYFFFGGGGGGGGYKTEKNKGEKKTTKNKIDDIE